MEKIPHALIEGMITSSYALGARDSYIYIRGEYFYIHRILENAIKEAYAAGFLGENILGTNFSHHVHMHIGAGAYICGEETALLESLEGKRGNPRIKPPFPAVAGFSLNGLPTHSAISLAPPFSYSPQPIQPSQSGSLEVLQRFTPSARNTAS